MSHDTESTQVSTIDDISSMVARIDSARSPADFTEEYDKAVDAVESTLIVDFCTTFGATRDFDAALVKLAEIAELRGRYLELLDEAARESGHPMSESLPKLREFAVNMDDLRRSLQGVVEAFIEYRAGRGADALRMLDEINISSDDPEINSVLAMQVRVSVEEITALIRRAALDYAGARAAYDRAAAVSQQFLTLISADLSPDTAANEQALSAIKGAQKTYEAGSLQMQYQEQLGRYDYADAIQAARAASAAFLESANCNNAVAPLLASVCRAQSYQALAEATMAEASMLLEDGRLDASSDLIGNVRDYCQAAALAWLEGGHASATVMQEQCLNNWSAWVVRFRRELDRERAHVARVEKLRTAVHDVEETVHRSAEALSHAEEIAHRADKVVSSLEQDAELCSRVEANARTLLREIPSTLAGAGLAPVERQRLSAEALELAGGTGDRPGSILQVAAYSQRLATALGREAEAHAPVAALLKALTMGA